MNKILVGMITVILILSVAGCASKPAGPVTIHVLTMDQAGLKPAEIDQIVKDFEAQNPDIKVNMEYLGYDYVHDKIVTGMAAKPPAYDAAMIDVIWPDEFIKAGYLLDVTNRVTADMKTNMFAASWNGVDGCEVFHVQQGHPAEGRHQRASDHLGGTGGPGQDHQVKGTGGVPGDLVVESEGRRGV
jgi:maltose-binding protein MalE